MCILFEVEVDPCIPLLDYPNSDATYVYVQADSLNAILDTRLL